ncbi:MAG: hypothetical protein WA001_04580 [Patescibacteria group bacterium]
MGDPISYTAYDERKAEDAWKDLVPEPIENDSSWGEECPDIVSLLEEDPDAFSKSELIYFLKEQDFQFGTIDTKWGGDDSDEDGDVMGFVIHAIFPDGPISEVWELTTETFVEIFRSLSEPRFADAMKQLEDARRVRIHNYLAAIRPIAKIIKESEMRVRLIFVSEGEFHDSVVEKRAGALYERLLKENPTLRKMTAEE